MRTNVSINGIVLTPEQIACLREVMLIDFISNSETLRVPDGHNMTVFYRYREFAHTWLDILDNNPSVNLLSQVGAQGLPGSLADDEPVAIVDGVRMNFLLGMEVRLALSSISFNEDEVKRATAKGIPMGELAKLQKIVWSIYKQDEKGVTP